MYSISPAGIFPPDSFLITDNQTGPTFQAIFIYYIQTSGPSGIGVTSGRAGLNAGSFLAGPANLFIQGDMRLRIRVKPGQQAQILNIDHNSALPILKPSESNWRVLSLPRASFLINLSILSRGCPSTRNIFSMIRQTNSG